jgi:hypothetical protein
LAQGVARGFVEACVVTFWRERYESVERHGLTDGWLDFVMIVRGRFTSCDNHARGAEQRRE